MRFAVSYFGNRILRHVREDMRALRGAGFDLVVHAASENDFRYYGGTLRNIVEVSRDAGLEVWLDPWGVGGVFGGEAETAVALEHPEWCQLDQDGARLPACCPSHPGFRRYLVEWIEFALASGADSVFWDEPHFFGEPRAGARACACEHCKQAAEAGRALEPDATAAAAAVLAFVHWACGEVARRGGRNAVCPLPHDGDPLRRAAWRACARAPRLASFGTTPFWALRGEAPEACVGVYAAEVAEVAAGAGTSGHVWIQGFRIPAGREEDIARGMRAAAAQAIEVIAFWGFEACAAMSALACERPERAWSTFIQTIRELRGA